MAHGRSGGLGHGSGGRCDRVRERKRTKRFWRSRRFRLSVYCRDCGTGKELLNHRWARGDGCTANASLVSRNTAQRSFQRGARLPRRSSIIEHSFFTYMTVLARTTTVQWTSTLSDRVLCLHQAPEVSLLTQRHRGQLSAEHSLQRVARVPPADGTRQ